MDENTVGGTVQQAAGKVQNAAGDVLGDAKTQAEGATREVAGKAQKPMVRQRRSPAALRRKLAMVLSNSQSSRCSSLVPSVTCWVS